jgi:hypothetical protein
MARTPRAVTMARFPQPPFRFVGQREADESAMRYRRSNRGGDDLATKIVFAIIILAIAGWIALAWFHREHTATKPPADIQRRL